MDAKKTIRKVLFIALWLCIGGGMFTLLLAAISKKNKGLCKDYHISIKGAHNNLFIEEKDVEQLLMNSANGQIRGRTIASFNLHELEQMLENNIWIENAEIYFDNRDILHVTVTEKEPVARIFATDGNSFYIDSLGRILPLSDKQSARVPLFTNFPGKKILSAKDSLLLDDIRGIANFIIRDSFWTSQAAQININSEKKFEMIPLIGNHIVKLGNGEDIVQKFRRLMIFYRQILSKTGFNKYKVIDVQYNGQVVATNFSGDTKIDSALLRKNVERLLQKTKEEPNDSLRRMMQVSIQKKTGADSAFSHATELPLMNEMNPGKKTNPENGRSDSLASAAVRNDGRHIGNTHLVNKENKPIQMGKKKPKAVMPKKPAEDANGGYN